MIEWNKKRVYKLFFMQKICTVQKIVVSLQPDLKFTTFFNNISL